MYQKGDFIIYGNTGVCEVTGIIKKEDTACEYYVLKPLYHNITISVPVNTNKIFMRPVISKVEAERLIDSIPKINPKQNDITDMRQLSAHYESFLETHECADLIELSMSIYEKKLALTESNRKLGSIDEKYMKRAEDLLFGELSVALGICKEEVTCYIEARVNGAAIE